MRRRQLMMHFVCLALAGLSSGAELGGDLESRLAGFTEEMDRIISESMSESDWNQPGDTLKAAYRHWFPDHSLAALMENANRSEAVELFYETFDYLIYVGQISEGQKLETVFRQLEQNGWVDDEIIEYMHKYLVMYRRFDRARIFRQAHPNRGLPAPPPIVSLPGAAGDNARTVLRFINDGSALEEQVIDLQATAKVLAIGHPRCHFTQNAIAAITRDPELSRAMTSSALWLVDPFSSLTDGVIARWNDEHPAYAYRYVEFKSDWPEVSYWGTPSFYFLKGGQLVKKVVGWPKGADEERKEALRDGLRAIGALPGK